MRGDDGGHEIEAQSVPWGRAAGIEPRQPAEHPLTVGLGNAGAVIVDQDDRLFAVARDRYVDESAARGMEQGVVQQVGDDR